MEDKKVTVAFSTLPFVETNIPKYTEDTARGKDWVAAGADNNYFNWLYSLYEDSATLQSLINGVGDYICGDEVDFNIDWGWGENKVNRKGETAFDVVGRCVADLLIYGGYYLNVIRNKVGQVREIYWLDYRAVRTDKDNQVFYYSKDFVDSKSYGRCKCVVYPKFNPDFPADASIYFYKRPQSRGIYPRPMYSGALKAVVTDIKINEFGLNEVSNNFVASAVINMNGGIPDKETKEKIERDIKEKFTGSENAGRFVLSFNEDKDHSTEIQRLGTDDFDKRYEGLQKRVQSQIYVAFRATPNLFGLPTATTGFNAQEYQSAYSLFYRSVIRPMQNAIVDSVNYITGVKGSLTIEPFTLNLDTNAGDVL